MTCQTARGVYRQINVNEFLLMRGIAEVQRTQFRASATAMINLR